MITFSQFLSENFNRVSLVQTGSGDSWIEWDIVTEYGVIGIVTVINKHESLNKAINANIDIITNDNPDVPEDLIDGYTSEGPKYKLGVSDVKSLYSHIKKILNKRFPNLKYLESVRATGIKADKGTARVNL